MKGRDLIKMVIDNNWLDAEFYFNAADDHNCYLPLEDNFITSGFNDEIDREYYKGVKNPPEIVVFEAC